VVPLVSSTGRTSGTVCTNCCTQRLFGDFGQPDCASFVSCDTPAVAVGRRGFRPGKAAGIVGLALAAWVTV
jgi:hypothetical protein